MITMMVELCGAYGTLKLAKARIAQLEEALYNQGNQPPIEPEQAQPVLPQEMLSPVPPTPSEVINALAPGHDDRFSSAPPHPSTYIRGQHCQGCAGIIRTYMTRPIGLVARAHILGFWIYVIF